MGRHDRGLLDISICTTCGRRGCYGIADSAVAQQMWLTLNPGNPRKELPFCSGECALEFGKLAANAMRLHELALPNRNQTKRRPP
jgi:hypothetical protein